MPNYSNADLDGLLDRPIYVHSAAAQHDVIMKLIADLIDARTEVKRLRAAAKRITGNQPCTHNSADQLVCFYCGTDRPEHVDWCPIHGLTTALQGGK